VWDFRFGSFDESFSEICLLFFIYRGDGKKRALINNNLRTGEKVQ
jgi:hypothetical protein